MLSQDKTKANISRENTGCFDLEINRFPANGRMLGFRVKIKAAALSYVLSMIKYHIKVLLSSSHLNGHTHGFIPGTKS